MYQTAQNLTWQASRFMRLCNCLSRTINKNIQAFQISPSDYTQPYAVNSRNRTCTDNRSLNRLLSVGAAEVAQR